MKITDLSNEQINYWVAKAQGWKHSAGYWRYDYETQKTGKEIVYKNYHPSTNWQQAGELVEKFKLELWCLGDNWKAGTVTLTDGVVAKADTPRKAICMAVIASVYGDEVNDEY